MTATFPLEGDCLDILRGLDSNSVDAIVTDPPYGLAEHKPAALITALTAWASGDREHVPDGRGFMGRDWDAFVPPPAVWDECLRVLKPGGHLLAFAGSRTADLMGLSVRMAGFEIRDTIMWIYGSGFPKSLDVSKAIDKARDDRPEILHVTAFVRAARDRAGLRNADVDNALGVSAMCDHWCRAAPLQALVPTWEQWQKLRELLAFGDEMDAEVWRLNGRKGTPGEAWEQREVIGERTTGVGTGRGAVAYIGDSDNRDITAPATDAARQWQGWGTALKPAQEPIIVARKPLSGTVAATVLEHGTGALNIDGCRTAHASDADLATSLSKNPGRTDSVTSGVYGADRPQQSVNTAGRWPSNVVFTHAPDCVDGGACVAGCPVADLDQQSGTSKSSSNPDRFKGTAKFKGTTYAADEYTLAMTSGAAQVYADSGGASRFFPVFRYQAKAPSRERPEVDGVKHPTVKPLALMSWLVRLVTPPGGIVLDPFAGSGTTLEAARAEGFDSIGIERDPAYYQLILRRLGYLDEAAGVAS